MSVLKIVHAIRSDGFSGVERYVLRLAVAQAPRGIGLHVIGGDPRQMRGPLAEAGVTHTPAARTAEVCSHCAGIVVVRTSSIRT